MTLPRYQVVLTSCTTGKTLAIFDSVSFWNLQYSRALNDVGKIALALPGNNQYRPLFALDNFLEVYRTSPVTGQLILEETYMIRLTHRFREENDERFVVGGVSLNHLLARRIINPTDDPAQAGGYITKVGAVDSVMQSLCNYQLGPGAPALRQIPGLIIAPVGASGANLGGRWRFENLLDIMKDLAHRGYMDFQITRGSGASTVLTIANIGADKTRDTNYPWNSWVNLNPDRGNLQRPSYQLDRTDEKNFVFEQGPGQGANRTNVQLGGDTITDSPFNRIEFLDDARQVDKTDNTSLMTSAKVSLFDNLPKLDFTFEPTGLEPGNIYRQDWDLGDLITATWDEYDENLRMIGVEIAVDEQGETIKVNSELYKTPGT